MMNDKIKIIALFGKSAAGKDTIKKWVVKNYPQIHLIKRYSTRPKRIRGYSDDYLFIEMDTFVRKIQNGQLIEAETFNGWGYGTDYKMLNKDKINIGSYSINAIECLTEDGRLDVLPVLIEASDKERLFRSLERENDCKEICRRFLADEKDYNNISFDYCRYRNCNSDEDWYGIMNLSTIKNFIEE